MGPAATPAELGKISEKSVEQPAAPVSTATTSSSLTEAEAKAEAESPTAKFEGAGSEKTEVKSSNDELVAVARESYRLQPSSFESLDGAEALCLKLSKKHGDLLRSVRLVVVTVTVPGRGDPFQVNSRPIPDREMVDETCLKLAIRDVPCLLIRAP